ncbi:Glycogen debranching enzyme, partial [Haemophilus influenzae]
RKILIGKMILYPIRLGLKPLCMNYTLKGLAS